MTSFGRQTSQFTPNKTKNLYLNPKTWLIPVVIRSILHSFPGSQTCQITLNRNIKPLLASQDLLQGLSFKLLYEFIFSSLPANFTFLAWQNFFLITWLTGLGKLCSRYRSGAIGRFFECAHFALQKRKNQKIWTFQLNTSINQKVEINSKYFCEHQCTCKELKIFTCLMTSKLIYLLAN